MACGFGEKYFGLNKSGDFRSVTADVNSEIEIVFGEDPAAVVLGELEAATVCDEELARAVRLLEDEHCLGAARPVGRTLV